MVTWWVGSQFAAALPDCACAPLRRAPTCRRERFELALASGGNEADGEAAAGGGAAAERYRFSRCRRALPAALMAKLGVPLPEGEREVLHEGLAWEEIQVRGGGFGCQVCGVGAPAAGCLRLAGGAQPPAQPALSPTCLLPPPLLSAAQWGPNGVSLRGQAYALVRCHFMPQAVKPSGDAAAPAAAK